MTLIKYEASIKLLTTTPVYELLQSALTIGTCQKKKKTDQQKQKPFLLSRSVHTRRQFAASRRSDRSLHVYRSGDELQQQGEATRRSDKSLFVYWRIFVKNIFVSATEFCCCNKSQKIKSD